MKRWDELQDLKVLIKQYFEFDDAPPYERGYFSKDKEAIKTIILRMINTDNKANSPDSKSGLKWPDGEEFDYTP